MVVPIFTFLYNITSVKLVSNEGYDVSPTRCTVFNILGIDFNFSYYPRITHSTLQVLRAPDRIFPMVHTLNNQTLSVHKSDSPVT